MTSDEIRNAKDLDPQYWWIWLQECAYQLAVMNERQDRPVPGMGNTLQGPWFGGYDQSLGSPVQAGSDTEVRRDIPDGPYTWGTPIEDLPLSVRAYNSLKNARINTVEQLRAMGDTELLTVKNLGRKQLLEIKEILSKPSPEPAATDPSA